MDYQPIDRDENSFQRPLSLHEIKNILKHAAISLDDISTVQELSSGMFNNAYLIKYNNNDAQILRIGPDRSVYVFSNERLLLRRENTIEPYFECIQAIIPQTVLADFSGDIIPRDYVLQTFLEGQLWDEIKDELDDSQTQKLWHQLGEIAQKIHSVTDKKFGFPEPLPQFDTWAEAVITIVSDMLADLQALELDSSGISDFIDLLDQGRHLLNEIEVPHLLHGDLWPKNVLLNDNHTHIVGLLDAERALWGDPEAEWVFHYLDELKPSFWEGYGRTFPPSFRTYAYLGLYSVQLFLEAYRFHYDDGFARDNLTQAMNEMRKFLNQ